MLSLAEILKPRDLSRDSTRSKAACCNKDSKVWTAEDVEQLTELYKNMSAEEIAATVGRTKAAVQRKLYLLKLSKQAAQKVNTPAIVTHPEKHITKHISKGAY
jgi:hypothetical protein